MRLSTISLGNLRRRKGKALLLISGLSIGIAMVVSLLGITFQMKADVERKLDEYGANIIVSPKTENLSLTFGGISVADTSYDLQELREEDAGLIMTIENRRNISAVAPKVIGTHTINNLAHLIVGVDFRSEFLIKKWWRLDGNKPGTEHEILLGHRVADTLKTRPGEHIRFGQREFTVAGILDENASQDDISIFMNIDQARELLNKEGATSMIEVSALCSECPIEDIVAQISTKLPHARVSPVRQAMTLRMQTVDQVMRFSLAVSVVVLLIGSFVVFVSMLSSVNERTREIGVLRAIGYRKLHVLKIILIEAFVVSLIAGVIGWGFGSFATSFLAPEDMVIAGFGFNPLILALAVAVSIAIGMISSIYPAVKASNLEPSVALRYI